MFIKDRQTCQKWSISSEQQHRIYLGVEVLPSVQDYPWLRDAYQIHKQRTL